MTRTRLFVVLCLGLAAIALLSITLRQRDTVERPALPQYLPWQIERNAAGLSVFGLTLDQSTLADSLALHGSDGELAVVAAHQQPGALEYFYPYFHAGPLQGKLIIVLHAPDSLIASLQQSASHSFLDNGSSKYSIAASQLASLQQQRLRSLTFAPSLRLDEAMLQQRFGLPAQIMQTAEQEWHYGYPDRGLIISLFPRGKALLHYLNDDDYQTLQQQIVARAVTGERP